MLLPKGVGWGGAPLEETACIDKDLILIGMEAVGKKRGKEKKKATACMQTSTNPNLFLYRCCCCSLVNWSSDFTEKSF